MTRLASGNRLSAFSQTMFGGLLILLLGAMLGLQAAPMSAQEIQLDLRYQEPTGEHQQRFHTLTRSEGWLPGETAIIVCDMWDAHHCLNAVRRVNEFAPRLNQVLSHARGLGVTIIHAPSACMAPYEDDPARLRAQNAPASDLPAEITQWCHQIPSEDAAKYPIDQSDGGEDDDPEEHAAWAKELEDRGLNPRAPWQRQTDLLTIDSDRDYISDQGDEIWNVLEDQGIKNVILTGVHTNMCVLGRPFGLRQMAKNGKNVVLMRDMTDTMYNPGAWPYVSHFTGTDLIVSHIERHVCPTITSDQLIGGEPFVFSKDVRPHVAFVIAEDEYKTEETLPQFAAEMLGHDFRVSFVFGSETERNAIPGIESISDADLLVISIRRRVLPTDDLAVVRQFVASGKPVIGIRTASHAFALRNDEPPQGMSDWPELDAEVFGGNYHGHHGNQLASTITFSDAMFSNRFQPSIFAEGIEEKEFPQGGSLYQTSPLADGAQVLAVGTVEGHPSEPVAWIFEREDGGRSFYTSLGHVDDFENPTIQRFLFNAFRWAAGMEPEAPIIEVFPNDLIDR